MKWLSLLIFCLILSLSANGQSSDQDALFLKSIHTEILLNGECHENLRYLCKEIGPRLSGTENYDLAAEYFLDVLNKIKNTSARFQPCTIRSWERGLPEQVNFTFSDKSFRAAKALALGFSVGTGRDGLRGEVVEVKSLDEVRTLGKEGVSGKIVFYNRHLDRSQTNTFRAYGGAVDQRVYGATIAAEYGALASISRSMTLSDDDVPHTGTLFYRDSIAKIPGLAISTNDANYLSEQLKRGPVSAYVMNTSFTGSERTCNTVIGEIKGSEFPEEIILVGGHLDSWDVGEGAHDDGTGVVQAVEVLRALQALNYQPKRTIRCVLFANEESGLSGGREYARVSNEAGEFHLAALESDSGGFSPNGFSFEGDAETFSTLYSRVSEWSDLFEAYGLLFSNGGSGADIGPLKSQKGLLIGLRPDSQRYFDFHHTHNDVWEAVNERELKLGAAAMASLVYMIDRYGLK